MGYDAAQGPRAAAWGLCSAAHGVAFLPYSAIQALCDAAQGPRSAAQGQRYATQGSHSAAPERYSAAPGAYMQYMPHMLYMLRVAGARQEQARQFGEGDTMFWPLSGVGNPVWRG